MRSPTWRQFSWVLARRFMSTGIIVGIGSLAGSLLNSVDNYLIATFLSTTILGYYDRAFRMAQWPGLVFNSVLSQSAMFTYAKLQGDQPRLQRTVNIMLRLCWIFGGGRALWRNETYHKMPVSPFGIRVSGNTRRLKRWRKVGTSMNSKPGKRLLFGCIMHSGANLF